MSHCQLYMWVLITSKHWAALSRLHSNQCTGPVPSLKENPMFRAGASAVGCRKVAGSIPDDVTGFELVAALRAGDRLSPEPK
jgi:hypothetical protein